MNFASTVSPPSTTNATHGICDSYDLQTQSEEANRSLHMSTDGADTRFRVRTSKRPRILQTAQFFDRSCYDIENMIMLGELNARGRTKHKGQTAVSYLSWRTCAFDEEVAVGGTRIGKSKGSCADYWRFGYYTGSVG
jgi:hypothetical protein